jgi:hypothetical protein
MLRTVGAGVQYDDHRDRNCDAGSGCAHAGQARCYPIAFIVRWDHHDDLLQS